MHMADALISPAVGLTMWGASVATIAYCSKKVQAEADSGIVPLMGVLGAFIFSVQMINFTIPVTGSSGHLGGGMILSVLLGPYAAFLTSASVLVVQAFLFSDGGLLALGCNIFNLGFFPAFIAYPLIYKQIVASSPTPKKISVASIIAAVVGLQLGAFAVVVETVLSGISSLPFTNFVAIMQPIHLAIGVIEGVVTTSVISFVYTAKPEILQSAMGTAPINTQSIRTVVLIFLAVAVLTGGILSWFASEQPDGVEWSITRVTGQKKLKGDERGVNGTLAALQKSVALLPDYSFKKSEEVNQVEKGAEPAAEGGLKTEEKKPEGSKLGTSVSGIVGGSITLAICFLIGYILKRRAVS